MSTFKFEFGRRKYVLSIKSKISVVTGLSASGKTAMCQDILHANDIKDTGITVIQDYGVDLSLFRNSSLLVIDEGCLNKYISKGNVDLLDKGFQYILIMSRDALRSLSYGYKDVYTLQQISGVVTLRRKYPDYNYIKEHIDYVEDQCTGYKYFKQFYPDVQSARGKDNLSKLPKDSSVVADGCALGSTIRLLYKSYQLFLPESFEWLLLRKHDLIPNFNTAWKPEESYYNKAHDALGCSKKILPEACRSRKYISDFEISDSVLREYLDNYECVASIEDIRKLMYNVTGDYSTEEVIKIAIVMYTLEKY